MLYDVPALVNDIRSFGPAHALDELPALPSPPSSIDASHSVCYAPSPDSDTRAEEARWGSESWSYDPFSVADSAAEVHAVDVLALEREFAMVPFDLPIGTAGERDITASGSEHSPAESATECHPLATVASALPHRPTTADVNGSVPCSHPSTWQYTNPPHSVQVPYSSRTIQSSHPGPFNPHHLHYGWSHLVLSAQSVTGPCLHPPAYQCL